MTRTTSLLASLALAAVAVASAGGTAEARNAGYVTEAQCTTLVGTAHYTPGLKAGAKVENEVITGTISGCTAQGSALTGTGSFSAVLSSPAASNTHDNESGTFVINWPSFYSPTSGAISTAGPSSSTYTASGSDTAGAFTGGVMSTSWLVTGKTLGGRKHNAIVAEQFVNTAPLTIKVNIG